MQVCDRISRAEKWAQDIYEKALSGLTDGECNEQTAPAHVLTLLGALEDQLLVAQANGVRYEPDVSFAAKTETVCLVSIGSLRNSTAVAFSVLISDPKNVVYCATRTNAAPAGGKRGLAEIPHEELMGV